jgi:hypothetical protein
MRIKIMWILQQDQQVFAARSEISGASRAFGTESLQLGKCVEIAPIAPDVGRWPKGAQ